MQYHLELPPYPRANFLIFLLASSCRARNEQESQKIAIAKTRVQIAAYPCGKAAGSCDKLCTGSNRLLARKFTSCLTSQPARSMPSLVTSRASLGCTTGAGMRRVCGRGRRLRRGWRGCDVGACCIEGESSVCKSHLRQFFSLSGRAGRGRCSFDLLAIMNGCTAS